MELNEHVTDCGAMFSEAKQAEIHQRVCALREKRNLSYQELSAITYISESTIARYFSGKTKAPQFYMVATLVMAMGGSLDEILGIQSALQTPQENPYQELIQAYQENILYQREHIEKMESNSRHSLIVSRITLFILMAVLGLVAFGLIYDILHPDRGWVQYAAEFARQFLSAPL